MKKLIVAVIAVCVLGGAAFGQSGMVRVNDYSKQFLNGAGLLARKYREAAQASDMETYTKVAALGGDYTDDIDTPFEIAALSLASGVIDIRPVEADAILPKSNLKLSYTKLAASAYQDALLARFLGNTAAVGVHEGELKFALDKGGITRAEVDSFYRQNIGAYVAAEVDAQFNRVAFGLYNYGKTVLTRNAQNQYVLSYESASTPENGVKTLTASSLEALLVEMSKRSSDFTSNDINTVRAQAALIPAVKLGSQSLDDIKVILTQFYTEPNPGTYGAVRDVYTLYRNAYIQSDAVLFRMIRDSYGNTLASLNDALAKKVVDESNRNPVATLSNEQQRRFTNISLQN